MKKTMLVLSILAAFAITGCSSPAPKAEESKLPSAAAAKKIEAREEVKTQKLDSRNPIKLTPPKENARMQGNGSKMGRF